MNRFRNSLHRMTNIVYCLIYTHRYLHVDKINKKKLKDNF